MFATWSCRRKAAAAARASATSAPALGLAGLARTPVTGRNRYQLLEQFDLLRNKRVGEKPHAGNVTARPVHARHETEFYRVRANGKDNGNGGGRGFRSQRRGGCAGRDEHPYLATCQLRSECGEVVDPIIRPAIFDLDGLPFDEPGLFQSLMKCPDEGCKTGSGARAEKSNHGAPGRRAGRNKP